MRLYRHMSRPFPKRLAAKMAAMIILGMVPLAVASFVGHMGAIVFGALASIGLTLWLVMAVLAPIDATNRALATYLKTRRIEHLPQSYPDALGKLMRLSSAVMRDMGRELDAAVVAAETDPLTGLMNRRGFERIVPDEAVGMVLFVDVDHFKRVNDEWGHAVGDEALVNLADAISSALRSRDLVARLGGEEFAVYADETVPSRALEVAERVRARVREKVSVWRKPLTVSVGVAVSDQPIARSALMAAADDAVYEAKARGRNCVVLGDTLRAA